MIRNLTLALLSAAIAAPLTAQIPCFNSTLGTSLELGDDDTVQGLSLGFTFTYAGVPYTQICVCSNGYVWLGATSVTGGDPTPSEAELSSGAPRTHTSSASHGTKRSTSCAAAAAGEPAGSSPTAAKRASSAHAAAV